MSLKGWLGFGNWDKRKGITGVGIYKKVQSRGGHRILTGLIAKDIKYM